MHAPPQTIMRICHRRRQFLGLGALPSDYGFDTTQVGKYYSGATLENVNTKVNNMDANLEAMNFFLALGFQGNDGANPHLYPNGYPGNPTPGNLIGTVDREAWYDNPNHAFYTDFKGLFSQVVNRWGARMKGVRWNHEIPPWLFKWGPRWVTYAEDNVHSQWQAIQSNEAENDRWQSWLIALSNGTLGENAAYEGRGANKRGSFPAPYRNTDHQGVQQVYKKFVDFQVSIQATMIGNLADRVEEAEQTVHYGPIHFLVYSPAYHSPAYPEPEYSLDLKQVSKPNIIWEIGGWERNSDAERNNWAREAGSRPYYLVLQQELNAACLTSRIARLPDIIENMLAPSTPNNTSPWQNSLGFWSNWDGEDHPGNGWTETRQQDFMNKIQEILTE